MGADINKTERQRSCRPLLEVVQLQNSEPVPVVWTLALIFGRSKSLWNVEHHQSVPWTVLNIS